MCFVASPTVTPFFIVVLTHEERDLGSRVLVFKCLIFKKRVNRGEFGCRNVGDDMLAEHAFAFERVYQR